MDINLILFLLVAAAFIFGFIFLLKFLSKRTSKGQQQLFTDLSKITGYDFLQEDTIGLENRIGSLLDFGQCKEPISKVVHGRIEIGDVFFFSCDDEPIRSGLRGFITPTWSVCLIETVNRYNLDMTVFQTKVWFGKLKKYKFFHKEWGQLKTADSQLEDYTVMSTDVDKCRKLIDDGLLNDFLNYAKTYTSKITPQCLTLQVRGRFLAVYGDQFSFDLPDEFIQCCNIAKAVHHALHQQ